jgi:hypothetical protein
MDWKSVFLTETAGGQSGGTCPRCGYRPEQAEGSGWRGLQPREHKLITMMIPVVVLLAINLILFRSAPRSGKQDRLSPVVQENLPFGWDTKIQDDILRRHTGRQSLQIEERGPAVTVENDLCAVRVRYRIQNADGEETPYDELFFVRPVAGVIRNMEL